MYELEEGGSVLRWCQGTVTMVSDGKNIRIGPRSYYAKGHAVMIHWDATELEPESESSKELLKSKWNPKGKHTDGSWQLADVRIKQK